MSYDSDLPPGYEVSQVREGESGFNFTGWGSGRSFCPRRIVRQLERMYGPRKKRLGLDWRVQGDKVVVYESVPMTLFSILPGLGFRTQVLVPITAIDADYNVNDIRRNMKIRKGEETAQYIEAAEQKQVREHEFKDQDIRHAAQGDWDGVRKGRRQLWQGGPSGGF